MIGQTVREVLSGRLSWTSKGSTGCTWTCTNRCCRLAVGWPPSSRTIGEPRWPRPRWWRPWPIPYVKAIHDFAQHEGVESYGQFWCMTLAG